MSEIEEVVTQTIEQQPETRLNSAVAVLVAVAATFMAACNIKDGNIVQAMAQAQSKSVSKWGQYQAKSTKQNIAESAVDQLKVQLALAQTPAAKSIVQAQLALQEANVKRYESEKGEVKKEAEDLEKAYDALNIHDDQFDMTEVCLSVALALFGITALTRKNWLFFFALSLTVIGVVLGISGFAGWSIHPDWLARLLG